MSERDVIKRERAAFVAGWLAYQDPTTRYDCNVEAAKRYPLPTITSPRVVRDPQRTNYGPASGHVGKLYWSVRDGRLHAVDRTGRVVPEWEDDQRRDSWPTPNRVAMWADLLANPNETVEE